MTSAAADKVFDCAALISTATSVQHKVAEETVGELYFAQLGSQLCRNLAIGSPKSLVTYAS